MDNNYGERLIRNPAVGRKNYYGSGSDWSGRLAMMMFSIFAMLLLWKINPRTWLTWYFKACAANTGQTPKDFENFLPWNVGYDRLKELRSATLPVPADSFSQAIRTKNSSSSISPLSQRNQLNSELPASTSAHTFGECLRIHHPRSRNRHICSLQTELPTQSLRQS